MIKNKFTANIILNNKTLKLPFEIGNKNIYYHHLYSQIILEILAKVDWISISTNN